MLSGTQKWFIRWVMEFFVLLYFNHTADSDNIIIASEKKTMDLVNSIRPGKYHSFGLIINTIYRKTIICLKYRNGTKDTISDAFVTKIHHWSGFENDSSFNRQIEPWNTIKKYEFRLNVDMIYYKYMISQTLICLNSHINATYQLLGNYPRINWSLLWEEPPIFHRDCMGWLKHTLHYVSRLK